VTPADSYGVSGMVRRVIIGLSGASGQIYGIEILKSLREMNEIETHLVMTRAAEMNILQETEYSVEEIRSLAHIAYRNSDVGAKIASGSFKTDGMIIAPTSIKTASAIANSYNSNLLIRAADVTLKEKRKLLLVVREAPLHSGHLKTLLRLKELGAIIFVPVPDFSNAPVTLEDMVNHTVDEILEIFGIL
jgi:4-hydroxy-3-polyprenylbenzoate decarboxylase